MATRRLSVEIIGDSASLERSFRSAGKAALSFGNVLKLGVGFKAVDLAQRGLSEALHSGIDEWKQHAAVAAQTANALRATGGVANVTAKHIEDLANSTLRKTGIDDEAIQHSENLLLAFKGVRNEAGAGNAIFDRTTLAIQDMAVATGKSADALTSKLGKALNDPAAGLGRLAQLGITFTDSQKEQIKALTESGHALDAQKIILAEVEGRYHGAAEAAGKTLPAQLNIAREMFNNFAGDLVARTVPAIENAIGWMRDHWPEVQGALQGFWSSAQPILSSARDLLGAVASTVQKNWPLIEPIVNSLKDGIITAMNLIHGALKLVADLLRGDWGKAWADARAFVGEAISGIKKQILDSLDLLRAAGSRLGGAIASGVREGVGELVGWLGSLMMRLGDALRNAVGALGSAAQSAGNAILQGFESALSAFGSMLLRLIKAPLNDVIGKWNAIGFDIDLPSVDTHIPGVGRVGGGHLSFHTPQISYLAEGGIITRPTLAMIGESGPEAVIPLRGADVSRGRGGDTYNITVNGWIGDDEALVRKIRNDLSRLRVREGLAAL